MRIPLIGRIGALVLATTAFYTYVGQMVPQKEVHPPEEIAVRADLTTAEMVEIGREIIQGKGLCVTCHTIGQSGALRFPDLGGIGGRAADRIPGMSDVEYLAQSLYEPDVFIVPGFNPGMPPANKPPIGLTDQEILIVIAFLQSLGGTPTVTLQTTHQYLAAPAAPGAAPPPADPPAPGEKQPLEKPRQGALLRPGTSSSDMVSDPNGWNTGMARLMVAGLPLAVSHETARPDGHPVSPKPVRAEAEPVSPKPVRAKAE